MRVVSLTVPLMALLLTGCAKYNVTFQVQDVINAPSGPNSRRTLDVDVLLVTKDDVKSHPSVANGTMRTDEWFKARAGLPGAPSIADIDRKRILALRGEGPEYSNYANRDTRVGSFLTSVSDNGKRNVSIEFEEWSKQAAIVIFGQFHDGKGGLLPIDPVVIKPIPSPKKPIVIDVGPMRMSRSEQK